ncbi:MAG: adenylate/guanylate cyclase domain-containing protein [Elusimicrobiota bacterium]
MSSAIIIFADIVSFSKEATAGQLQLIEGLTAEVKKSAGEAIERGNAIALPTGDGLAVAFLNYSGDSAVLGKIFELTLQLHKWARAKSTCLRIGIHLGPIEFITDINGRKNICGYTVNLAQRVMDAANPCQTLLSEDAFEQLIGRAKSSLASLSFTGFVAKFEGPIDLYAKHGKQILVYKLALEPKDEYYDNDDPKAKHLMMVSLTDLPKEIVGTFSERIAVSDQIAFIQLTGDRFLDQCEAGAISFSRSLKQFLVLMPNPKSYASLGLKAPHASAEFVTQCIERWKKFLVELRTSHPSANIKLGLYMEPPYYGASLLNWEEPGGRVHVSPYVWGLKAKDCPGFDVEWIGRKRPPIYERYVKGLQYLDCNTKNELSE